jgi:hypothetical protein
MAKDKKTPLSIDGVDYNFEDLTPEQQVLVNHIADLDRKIAGSKFSLDQMQVGRDAFFAMLKTALEPKEDQPKG